MSPVDAIGAVLLAVGVCIMAGCVVVDLVWDV